MSGKALKLCPICGWKTMPIVYGLPSQRDSNQSDIILGGCIIDEGSPDIACGNCDWSGQEWHLTAPLPPRVWILMDPNGLTPSIGLTAGRYDDVMEVFLFGHWYNIIFTQQYLEWVEMTGGKPLAFTAPFGDLSPALIAEMRIGNHRFKPSELCDAGFRELDGEAPKFEFQGRMERIE
jgi:hypothetical protein